MIVTAE